MVLIIILFILGFAAILYGIANPNDKSAARKGRAAKNDSPSLIDTLIVGAAAAHLMEKGEERRQLRRREREQRDRDFWQWQEATRDRIRKNRWY